MLKTVSLTALVAAAMLAAVVSPVSAASLTNNVAAGHISAPRVNNVSPNNIGASNQYFTPNGHGPKLKPPVKVWVCGPIVNWDGSKHCHWVTH
jgi:hypothetical protein